jgi:hypothetical protein
MLVKVIKMMMTWVAKINHSPINNKIKRAKKVKKCRNFRKDKQINFDPRFWSLATTVSVSFTLPASASTPTLKPFILFPLLSMLIVPTVPAGLVQRQTTTKQIPTLQPAPPHPTHPFPRQYKTQSGTLTKHVKNQGLEIPHQIDSFTTFGCLEGAVFVIKMVTFLAQIQQIFKFLEISSKSSQICVKVST